MCPSLIQIGSKTAEKNSAQTNKQTDKQTDRQTNRHYENNGHFAVNQSIWRQKSGTASNNACPLGTKTGRAERDARPVQYTPPPLSAQKCTRAGCLLADHAMKVLVPPIRARVSDVFDHDHLPQKPLPVLFRDLASVRRLRLGRRFLFHQL